MAIFSILPRKIMKNQTRQKSMSERHDYDQKQEKTNGGEFALGLNSAPRYAPISPRPPGSYASQLVVWIMMRPG